MALVQPPLNNDYQEFIRNLELLRFASSYFPNTTAGSPNYPQQVPYDPYGDPLQIYTNNSPTNQIDDEDMKGKTKKIKIRDSRSALKVGMKIKTKYYHESSSFENDVTCTVKKMEGDRFIVNNSRYNNFYISWNRDEYIEIPFVISEAEKKMIETIVIEDEKREEIMSAISQIQHQETIFNEWGFEEVFEKGTAIALLFHGSPGTGKTLMAQAIANYLGQELRLIQTAEIWTSEPGGAERALKGYFQEADKQGQLLLFDECDSLIYDRNAVGMILAAEINALLSALENYKGVVIFTTNRLGKLDPAFERRVSAKIEFNFPTEPMRHEIWKRMIPKKAPLHKGVSLERLAKFPLAGGNIKNVVLNAARLAAFKGLKHISEDCFADAIEREIGGMDSFKKGHKSLQAVNESDDVQMGESHSVEVVRQVGTKKGVK